MRMSLIFAAALTLSGCGAQEFFFNKDISLTPGHGQMSDIKQRGVFVQSRPDQNGVISPVVCAEPSPDAMAAVAASIAGSAAASGSDGASGSLAASASESAAYVGLRTQTIQLLRDGFYRMCEGYMSGALTAEDYTIMQRRYQANMLALLAIEQLTGTVKSSAVAIDTATAALAQGRIAELTTTIKQEQAKTPPGDTKALEEERRTWVEALTGVRSRTLLLPDSPQKAEAAEKVAQAVQEIVRSVVEQDNSGQMCFEYFRRDKNQDPSNPLRSFCTSVLQNISKGQDRKVDAMQECFERASTIADAVMRRKQIEACKYIVPGTKSMNSAFAN